MSRLERALKPERGHQIHAFRRRGNTERRCRAIPDPAALFRPCCRACSLDASWQPPPACPNLCTIDMGGTSLDVCLIREGEPDSRDTIEVEWGIPARTQSIDIHSIGAGGGSIVWFDAGGALRIGPESAGSDPGPACYGRGGVRPTVTDANLILGILNPEGLLGGKLRLDRNAGGRCLGPDRGQVRDDRREAAAGIYRIVTADLAEAIREVTVKRGTDPRDFNLVAFGGQAASTPPRSLREMEMKGAIFPRNASTFSAFGLLTANLKNSAARSLMVPLAEASEQSIEEDFRRLEEQCPDFSSTKTSAGSNASMRIRWADVRYLGQSHEVAVPIDPASDRPERNLRRTSNDSTSGFMARGSATQQRS